MTVFTQTIADRIKTGLNNADQRRKRLIFRTDVSEQYDSLMVYVVRLDSAMHRINPVALKIAPLVGKKDTVYRLDRADSAVLNVVIPAADAVLRETKAKADQFFNAL